ncbi:MAG TPA: UDP-N-acetylglucosamine--LPS N-acetylglucosamine transferase [Firmicutes bacterium]|nr:UDP-N-acetylglucosamine--LPS N-acetylglucosamine transferase [Bacillota bacterium]
MHEHARMPHIIDTTEKITENIPVSIKGGGILRTEPRILIVSASIGTGHNQAAAAIGQELRSQRPRAQIDIIDFLQYGSYYRGSLLRETYLKMLHLFPEVFDFLFRWTAGKGQQVKSLFAYSSKNRITELRRQFKPHILVCTHPFPCAAACCLKGQGALDLPVAAVVTDFGVHPFWIYQEVDAYFVAHDDLRPQLVDRGIHAGRVRACGIPIGKQYSAKVTRAEGVIKEEPVILIMGGGLGLGPLDRVLLHLEAFPHPLRVLVVTAGNRKLLPKLREMAGKSRHKISIFGFTEKIDQLMGAADLLITKAGGLTAGEALAKGLPMLLIPVIPGHEAENARFLVQQGAAVQVRDVAEITRCLKYLLVEQPGVLDGMRTAAAALAKPDAARDIAAHIVEMAGRANVKRALTGRRKG